MFQIKDFDFTAESLQIVAGQYSWLQIASLTDVEWYNKVRAARLDLRAKRNQIAKAGKEMRDEANAFAKNVIAREKELIGIIEPIEDTLKQEEDKYNEMMEKQKRIQLLPERKARIAELEGVEVTDEDILSMDDMQFEQWILQERNRIITQREAKIAADQAALEAQKAEVEKKEQEQARAAEIAKAQEEAAAKAVAETETRIKREAEEAKQKEEQEKQTLEKKKKYRSFLDKNGRTEENQKDYIAQKDGNCIILYKKVDTFIID